MVAKVKILEQSVIRTLTYRVQTWSITKTQKNSLNVTHFKILRSIMKKRLKDKVKFSKIQEQTGPKDIGWMVKKAELNYAGVRDPEKWGKVVEEGSPREWGKNREDHQ